MIARFIVGLVLLILVVWFLSWTVAHAVLIPVVILGCGVVGWHLRRSSD
jgi:hypothetical protein